MPVKIFDRETLLDLTVNFIPLGIMIFFIGVFVVFAPWGFDPLVSSLQFGIVGGMAVLLTILTYYSGKAISTAEKELEGEHEEE